MEKRENEARKLETLYEEKKEIERVLMCLEHIAHFTICPHCLTPIDEQRIHEDIEWYRERLMELNETIRSLEQELIDK